MRIIETKVYKFDELSEKAREKARDWYRESALDYDWWDCIYEDAATIAALMGIDIKKKAVKLMNGATRYDPAIYFSGFSCQGDGACFEGSWKAQDATSGKVQEHAPTDTELHRIAAEFEALAKKYPEAAFTVNHSGHYSHKYETTFDFSLPDQLSEDEYQAVAEALKEAARDLMEWIYRQLEKEYQYLMSDEAVDDSIRANEYEFTESGEVA